MVIRGGEVKRQEIAFMQGNSARFLQTVTFLQLITVARYDFGKSRAERPGPQRRKLLISDTLPSR